MAKFLVLLGITSLFAIRDSAILAMSWVILSGLEREKKLKVVGRRTGAATHAGFEETFSRNRALLQAVEKVAAPG